MLILPVYFKHFLIKKQIELACLQSFAIETFSWYALSSIDLYLLLIS